MFGVVAHVLALVVCQDCVREFVGGLEVVGTVEQDCLQVGQDF